MKDAKIDRVCLLIIQEYLKAPGKKLNIQSIAKKAGVSRAWIYKYFGSTQEEMMFTTIDSISSRIVQSAAPEKTALTPKEWGAQLLIGINGFLTDIEAFPDVFRFYVMTKITPSKFSDRFQYHEDRFLTKRSIPLLKNTFGFAPDEAKRSAELIHSLRIGMGVKWLEEKNKTALGRTKILKTMKLRILDQFAKP